MRKPRPIRDNLLRLGLLGIVAARAFWLWVANELIPEDDPLRVWLERELERLDEAVEGLDPDKPELENQQ